MLSHYPAGHPLYASTTDENLEDLGKLKLEDIKEYYTDFYGANNSVSVFVGELDKKTINEFLQNTFGNWNSKANYKELELKYFDIKGTTETINTPDKTNAMLVGGTEPEYFP